MQTFIFDTYELMALKAAEFIAGTVEKKGDSLLCFAAGDTPTGIFRCLANMQKQGRVDFGQSSFIGLDEWVGLNRQEEGGCMNYMYAHLFEPLGIEDSNIVFFDAASGDLQQECVKVDEYVRKHGPIDLMLLGIGMNGHLGLNEPGVPEDLHSHIVDLDPVTKTVAQKYFKNGRSLEKGITLGIRDIMEAKCVVLIVSGAKKAEIMKEIMEGGITNALPASLVKNHGNALLFMDRDAASLLDNPGDIV